MSADPSEFLSQVDARVGDYVAQIRERAAAAKAELASGTLALRRQAEPASPAPAEPADAAEPWAGDPVLEAPVDDGTSPADVFGDFTELEDLPGSTNGVHFPDAPIFPEADSFLSDDLDFSIDLDDSPPNQ